MLFRQQSSNTKLNKQAKIPVVPKLTCELILVFIYNGAIIDGKKEVTSVAEYLLCARKYAWDFVSSISLI
jgi:hypothetical protein